MSLPPQTSFSTATTAVASNRLAYPSAEELASFKLPHKHKADDTNSDSHYDESGEEHKPVEHPVTPTPPSPVSTESSDHQISDDTPSTVYGKSMISPRNTLSEKKASGNIPATPRWPFQDATPRGGTVMVPITRCLTDSSSNLNSGRRSPPGEVSVSESLDEFQLRHPHARILALHPATPNYTSSVQNLANLPELVEVPFRQAESVKPIPMSSSERLLNILHNRRLSRNILRARFRRHEQRKSGVKPATFWFQRISTQQDMFKGCQSVALFLAINMTMSTSILVTLGITGHAAPSALIVWTIVSGTTFLFSMTIVGLMVRFRHAVKMDEENRGRSKEPKMCWDSEKRLAASPHEVAHRCRLGAAYDEEAELESPSQRVVDVNDAPEMVQIRNSYQFETHPQQSMGVITAPETEHGNEAPVGTALGDPTAARDPSSAAPQAANIPRTDTDEQIETYWTDVSVVPSSNSAASSVTAVIASAPAVPTTNPASRD
ncbi:hypothetical protein CSOJ01_12988 [Colletotrichum sojae]|uniref:Transmembrane protein n=1 Tax=Colletotrichum sojae TaxID=2175907 RepID=A0A8H6ITP9_9PEZI|nr:hypothetical protein CSOJ01_12988 [Colletotrichum sojae]